MPHDKKKKPYDYSKDDVKRSKGSYQKVIVADQKKLDTGIVKKRIYKRYYVFEIQLNQKVNFKLKVLNAKNINETGQNVYWIFQDSTNFEKHVYGSFESHENKNDFQTHLNTLNIGTKYEVAFFEDGSENPDYIHYTEESTKCIGKNYLPTNPFKSNRKKREGILLGSVSYTPTVLGKGLWIEGINYTPEFESQGAFMIAVSEPQILNLYVEKRYRPEKIVRESGVITDQEDTTHVTQELTYGNMLDIHINLHNILDDYTCTLGVFYEDTSMSEGYSRIIDLDQNKKDNPSLDYNRKFIEELVVDLRWAGRSKHKEGKDDEDSLQDYKMVLTFRPTNADEKSHAKDYPIITREITFTVNYKGNFSYDEHEPSYITQVVKVHKPPLVSQSFEDCRYTSLSLKIGNQPKFNLLYEEKDGSLSGKCTDNKTAVYQLVAGNVGNVIPVLIEIDAEVSTCEDSTLKHQNNTFNIEDIIPLEFKKGKGVWKYIKNKNIFPEVQPFTLVGKITESSLAFNAAYPYQAWSESTFLFKYLTWQIDPIELFIGVRSCRYVRTPSIYIYPDMVWSLHFNYGIKENEILYFQNKKVNLIFGYANYMDYIKDAVLWIYEPFKEYFDTFFPNGNQDKLEELVKALGLDDAKTYARLGLHVRYDGDKEIDYTAITRYKAYMYYLIFQFVMVSLAVDLFILYLTRGKALEGKALKLQRTLKRVKKRIKSIEEATELEFAILYPKINANAGIYRISQENGEIATIIEATIQAKPLIGLNVKCKFDLNEKKGVSLIDKKGKEHKIKKFKWLEKLVATFELDGQINTDINIKYNTHSQKFTTNENGVKQELKNGYILKNKGSVVGYAELKGKIVLPVSSRANAISLHITASADTDFGFSEAKVFGIDTIGPFFRIEYTIEEFSLNVNIDVVAKKGRKTLYDIKKAFLEFFGIDTNEEGFEKMFFEEKKILLPKLYLFDPLRQFKK